MMETSMTESMIEALTNTTEGAVIQAVLEASWGRQELGQVFWQVL